MVVVGGASGESMVVVIVVCHLRPVAVPREAGPLPREAGSLPGEAGPPRVVRPAHAVFLVARGHGRPVSADFPRAVLVTAST